MNTHKPKSLWLQCGCITGSCQAQHKKKSTAAIPSVRDDIRINNLLYRELGLYRVVSSPNHSCFV